MPRGTRMSSRPTGGRAGAGRCFGRFAPRFRFARPGGAVGASLPCALALAPRPTVTAFPTSWPGRLAGTGVERTIVIANTHEPVASPGLDDSHAREPEGLRGMPVRSRCAAPADRRPGFGAPRAVPRPGWSHQSLEARRATATEQVRDSAVISGATRRHFRASTAAARPCRAVTVQWHDSDAVALAP